MDPIDFRDPQWISALALAALAAGTFLQLGRIARHARRAADALGLSRDLQLRHDTLEAVRRYETDPQLRESIKHLYDKTIHGTDYSLLETSDRFHVVTLLNYFDGIACGIAQGLILEPLVKDYLQVVLDKAVRALIRGEDGPTWVGGTPLVSADGYEVLLDLHRRWVERSNATLHQMLR
jgi:hypothetical protein